MTEALKPSSADLTPLIRYLANLHPTKLKSSNVILTQLPDGYGQDKSEPHYPTLLVNTYTTDVRLSDVLATLAGIFGGDNVKCTHTMGADEMVVWIAPPNLTPDSLDTD